MSSEFHQKRRYSRYFMAPVWIALALCGMVLAFLLGGWLITDEWSRQDKETITDYKGVSPSSALALAAEGVEHRRVEFGVYRGLLRASLAEQTTGARDLAFRSIRDVLQYGGDFADDLRAELKGMAPQLLITTTANKAGIAAADALVEELREVGMAIVNREASTTITESKVSCYSADTCKDAKTLVSILHTRGYKVDDVDASSRSEETSDDEARKLYGAKVIRVALMDPKQVQRSASPSIAVTRSRSATPHQRLHALGRIFTTAHR
jgi:hypothetical protein